MSKICVICCEKCNKSNRTPVKCQYCEFESCRECVERYLIQDDIRDPVCMNPSCGRPWIHEFLSQVMYKSFMNNEFKKHREKMLFNLEMSFLPATQLEIEKEMQIEDIGNEIEKKHDMIHKIKMDILELTIAINRLRNKDVQKEERREFVRSCPVDGCRGFLSTAWKCGICRVYVCKECHEIKQDDDHECNADMVESAKLLKKETKNCPKCTAVIYKVSGCFAKDTPIPLFDGSTKMSQDICVGDELIGDDSLSRVVQKLFTGEDNLYKVIQDDGLSYVVNTYHKLVLRMPDERVIKWNHTKKTWGLEWFDRDALKLRRMDVTAFAYDELARFRDIELEFDVNIEVTIQDFMKLDSNVQNRLYGFKKSFKNTRISIEAVGRGQYWGWRIDDNHRFTLTDRTVVHNCDQMFCTQCHVAFSWETMKIVTGRIHNPHYYDWLRSQSTTGEIRREQGDGDDPCADMNVDQRLPNQWILDQKLRASGFVAANKQQPQLQIDVVNFWNIYRVVVHILDVVMTRYPHTNVVDIQANMDIRKKYIRGLITKDEFQTLLHQREKKRTRYNEYHDVFAMFTQVCCERFWNITRLDVFAPNEREHFFSEMKPLRVYVNNAFEAIGKRYKTTYPCINNEWQIISIK